MRSSLVVSPGDVTSPMDKGTWEPRSSVGGDDSRVLKRQHDTKPSSRIERKFSLERTSTGMHGALNGCPPRSEQPIDTKHVDRGSFDDRNDSDEGVQTEETRETRERVELNFEPLEGENAPEEAACNNLVGKTSKVDDESASKSSRSSRDSKSSRGSKSSKGSKADRVSKSSNLGKESRRKRTSTSKNDDGRAVDESVMNKEIQLRRERTLPSLSSGSVTRVEKLVNVGELKRGRSLPSMSNLVKAVKKSVDDDGAKLLSMRSYSSEGSKSSKASKVKATLAIYENVLKGGGEITDSGVKLKRQRTPSPLNNAMKNVVDKVIKAIDRKEIDKDMPKSSQHAPKAIASTKQAKKKVGLPPLHPSAAAGQQRKRQKEKNHRNRNAIKIPPKLAASGSSCTTLASFDSKYSISSTNDQWTGCIVGLRLPPDVEGEFDSKYKPTTRRVDPSKFLVLEEGKSSDEYLQNAGVQDARRNPWKEVAETATVSLNIHLSNRNDPSSKSTKIQLLRDPSEDVTQTLKRLQLTMQKKLGGKKKKTKKPKKGVSSQSESAVLLRKSLNGSSSSAMQQQSQHATDPYSPESLPKMEDYECVDFTTSLTIDEVLHKAETMSDIENYALSVPISSTNGTLWVPLLLNSCPPTITSVSTFGSFDQSYVFERTPIVLEVGLCHATKAKISWFADDNQVCANSNCYTPTEADVGKTLTVVITPQRPNHGGRGCEEAYQFKRKVEALPPLPNLNPLRKEFLNRSAQVDEGPMSLRVVTYNILADQNASRDVKKNDDADRMYSHCLNEHIVKFRRHPLILHEILEYSPDVLTLQEVDVDIFEKLLQPVLCAKGYEGYFSKKGVDDCSGIREGCAIFWSLDVFESVRPADMQTHTFREMVQQFSCEERMHRAQWKSLDDMVSLLDKHDHLKHVLFNKLGHVMQTVVLTQRKSQEKVVVGNT
ncbi:hypothetical protein ACHAWF_013611 [Thalassiosira exigua]